MAFGVGDSSRQDAEQMSSRARQCDDAPLHLLRHAQDGSGELWTDVHLSLVFGDVPLSVRLVQHAPLFRRKVSTVCCRHWNTR